MPYGFVTLALERRRRTIDVTVRGICGFCQLLGNHGLPTGVRTVTQAREAVFREVDTGLYLVFGVTVRVRKVASSVMVSVKI